MSVDIVTMAVCASNYGTFTVPGSKPGTSYTVNPGGPEGADGWCSCPSWKYRRDCKHMRLVWDQACLANHWRSGPEHDGTPLAPVSTESAPNVADDPCPVCGGPQTWVRVGV